MNSASVPKTQRVRIEIKGKKSNGEIEDQDGELKIKTEIDLGLKKGSASDDLEGMTESDHQKSMIIQYRATTRVTSKQKIPNNTLDLWAMFGHFTTMAECETILKKACESTTLNPINPFYAKGKSSSIAFKKDVRIARILAFKTARQLMFDLLKRYDQTSEKQIIPKDAQLEDYFIQFFPDGKKYPGDIEETDEFLKEVGISMVELPKKEAVPRKTIPDIKEGGKLKSNAMLQRLLTNAATIEKTETDPDAQRIRTDLIARLLSAVSNLTTTSLRDEVVYLENVS